jgi:hypothetical protein
VSTRHPVARALPQPCRAPRVLITQPHGLYINHIVRRDYSSLGRTGSTTATLCTVTTHLSTAAALPQLCRATGCITRLIVDYFTYVVRPGASAPRAARRRLFHLCHVSCTGLTLTTHRSVALALLRLCRASGRAVSP